MKHTNSKIQTFPTHKASVTLPDVSVVIDTCTVKEIDFNTDLQMSALVMKKASKDSLRQRKGRAGRVQVNLVFSITAIFPDFWNL